MRKTTIWILTVGNILEWYDYAIYGALAPIIAKLFFPNYAQNTAILLTLTIFAIGFICRPFGGFIFGHIADKYGRKPAFLSSIVLMALPTFTITILPTYHSIGLMAPVLLAVCRLLQGIAIGGEYPTAASYIYETAPIQQRGFYGSFLNVGTVVGVICATFIVILLNQVFSAKGMQNIGWRIAFLLTAISTLLTFYLRTQLTETANFIKLTEKKLIATIPLKEVFTQNKIIIIKLFFYLICAAIAYYSYNVYTVSFLKTQARFTYNEALLISLFSSIVLAVFIPFSGKLADKLGRKAITIIALSGFIVLTKLLYFLILSKYIYTVLLAQFIFGFILALYLGALPCFICEQVFTKLRVSTIAIGYNLSLTIFGGTAPMINMLLIHMFHTAYAPSYYLIIAAIISLIATFTMQSMHDS